MRVAERELADGADELAEQLDDAPFPSRPSIPPALGLALGAWAGCAFALSGMQGMQLRACLALGAACAAGCIGALALAWRAKKGELCKIAIAGLALGACLGCIQASSLHAAQQRALQMAGPLSIVALADGSSGDYGVSCLAEVSDDSGARITATVMFPSDAQAVACGELYRGFGSVSEPSEIQAERYWQRGSAAAVKLRSCERIERRDARGALVAFRARAVEALIEPARADQGLAAAIACGWRAALPEDVYQAFQVSGLAHVVAVSGAHLSIVAAFIAAAGRALRLPRPALIAGQALLLMCYLVLTALPISAIRACVMTFAGMLSWTARRRASSLSALGCCIFGVVVLDPQAALSASFALSALSTLGIVAFGGLFGAWLRHAAKALPAFARDALSLTLASSVLATPLSVSLFSQLPLISPVANLVCAPLFGPVCTAAIVGACASAALPGAAPLASLACAGARLLLGAVSACASVPYASIPASISFPGALGLSLALSAGLWAWWPVARARRGGPGLRVRACAAACCALAFALAASFRPSATEIVALDVGQGDAILVRSGAQAMLVDTGNQDGKLREALARQGVAKLDALLITHPDDDHMGSLSSLAGVVQVERVVVARDALSCPCASCGKLVSSAERLVGQERVEGLDAGDRFTLGLFSCTCLRPERFVDEGGNADSVCLAVDADVDADGQRDWRALLVGDAERDQVAAMLDSGDIGRVDVYKVGHHGSKNALTAEQAQALSPSISLCSVGAGNRYGHPAQATVEALEAAGSEVLRTDERGDVVCRFTDERIDVSCLR